MRALAGSVCRAGRRHRRGFTLIELLIGVGIVGVLLAILIPAVHRATASARLVRCAANLRGLHQANSLYAESNRGSYVRAAADMFGPVNRQRWHGVRKRATEPFDPALSPLAAYLGGDGRMQQDPAFAPTVQTAEQGAFEAGCGGYGYNHAYIGARADRFGLGQRAFSTSARTAEVGRPAETVMFADTAYLVGLDAASGMMAYSFAEPPLHVGIAGVPAGAGPLRPNPSLHFRHSGRANTGWADGHVAARGMSFSGPYITHGQAGAEQAKAAGLGWFGPEDNSLFDLD